jgi:ATP-dependent RNA helicase DDX18/HAS1
MSQHYFLHKSAQEGYKGFVRAYASHKEKRLFDVEKLDLKGVAKSFGFSVPPFVDLSILLLLAQFSLFVCLLSRSKKFFNRLQVHV